MLSNSFHFIGTLEANITFEEDISMYSFKLGLERPNGRGTEVVKFYTEQPFFTFEVGDLVEVKGELKNIRRRNREFVCKSVKAPCINRCRCQ